jgi:hypothetical protein
MDQNEKAPKNESVTPPCSFITGAAYFKARLDWRESTILVKKTCVILIAAIITKERSMKIDSVRAIKMIDCSFSNRSILQNQQNPDYKPSQ